MDPRAEVDQLPEEERAEAITLIHDAVAPPGNVQMSGRGMAKAALRRRAVKLSLKARIAARAFTKATLTND